MRDVAAVIDLADISTFYCHYRPRYRRRRCRNYFALSTGAKYCDQRGCLSVCLSALISQKNRTSKLHEISPACCLWPWLGPPLTTIEYVMYFRFC